MTRSDCFIVVLCIVLIGGCAASREAAEASGRVDYDPIEPFNRTIYGINDTIDRYTLKPLARGYRNVVPSPVRRSVGNFSDNLLTPRSALNGFLQGSPEKGLSDLSRFVLNTVFGIGGLFDVASYAGLEEYNETFSQTLAVWGLPEGPYVYLPIFGPNSLLDALALPVDFYSDPLAYYDDDTARQWIYFVRTVDLRARLLAAEALIEDSPDPYITVRESYLQNRAFQIHDGDPPVEEDEFLNEFLNEAYEEYEEEE